jgi:hypothetical protein
MGIRSLVPQSCFIPSLFDNSTSFMTKWLNSLSSEQLSMNGQQAASAILSCFYYICTDTARQQEKRGDVAATSRLSMASANGFDPLFVQQCPYVSSQKLARHLQGNFCPSPKDFLTSKHSISKNRLVFHSS